MQRGANDNPVTIKSREVKSLAKIKSRANSLLGWEGERSLVALWLSSQLVCKINNYLRIVFEKFKYKRTKLFEAKETCKEKRFPALLHGRYCGGFSA